MPPTQREWFVCWKLPSIKLNNRLSLHMRIACMLLRCGHRPCIILRQPRLRPVRPVDTLTRRKMSLSVHGASSAGWSADWACNTGKLLLLSNSFVNLLYIRIISTFRMYLDSVSSKMNRNYNQYSDECTFMVGHWIIVCSLWNWFKKKLLLQETFSKIITHFSKNFRIILVTAYLGH